VTFQTTWFVVSLLTELAVLLVLRTRGPLRGSRPSRLLILATLATALIALALPYTGAAAREADPQAALDREGRRGAQHGT